MCKSLLSVTSCSLLILALLGGCVQTGKRSNGASVSNKTQRVALTIPARTEAPLMIEQGSGSVTQTAACLLSGIRDLKIPDEFIGQDTYSQGATVKLVNPATGNDGLIFDVLPNSGGSQISVYSNGMDVSQRWRRMVSRCASQPGSSV